MYAAKLVSRRFAVASKVFAKSESSLNNRILLNTIAVRNHVHDKRNYYPERDDYFALSTARPWDHFNLRMAQNRMRRTGQYYMWIIFALLSYGYIRYMVIKQRNNKIEKWDWQCKYWREGYWIREFPEGLVVKEFSNGTYSIEPGQSQRPGVASRVIGAFFQRGTTY